MTNNIYLIGCGGVGGYLAPVLAKHMNTDNATIVTCVDGDVVETGNLTRQNFRRSEIGTQKAGSLASKFGFEYRNEYIDDNFTVPDGSVIFCCVDNHPARRRCIEAVDKSEGSILIICANEYRDAQVCLYLKQWAGTEADYRVRFPEVLTDTDGSPNDIHCDSPAALASSPQLALFNNLAAAMGLGLYYDVTIALEEGAQDYVPYQITCAGGSMYQHLRLKGASLC